MKESATDKPIEDDMRPEYDLSGGVQGKHYKDLQRGYTVTIHYADGTSSVTEVKPGEGVVVLAPDVRQYFPDSDSVNAVLRSLIGLVPKPAKAIGKDR